MDADHVMPPSDSIDAMIAIARHDDDAVEHLRRCPRCRLAWYRAGAFRAGCTDPRLGAVVMGALGHTPPPEAARAHIEVCLACRLLVLDATRAMRAGRTGA